MTQSLTVVGLVAPIFNNMQRRVLVGLGTPDGVLSGPDCDLRGPARRHRGRLARHGGHRAGARYRRHPILQSLVMGSLLSLLDGYQPADEAEAADVEWVRQLAQTTGDPWRRSLPLHVTGSALIVHPGTGRVLLRWHQRQQGWLHVGGHGDPGESDPLAIALREAREETGLADLAPWPDAQVRQVVIVPVPASSTEPAHQHADVRFILATQDPEAARPEGPDAPLRWLPVSQAREATSEANLRTALQRVGDLLAAAGLSGRA